MQKIVKMLGLTDEILPYVIEIVFLSVDGSAVVYDLDTGKVRPAEDVFGLLRDRRNPKASIEPKDGMVYLEALAYNFSGSRYWASRVMDGEVPEVTP